MTISGRNDFIVATVAETSIASSCAVETAVRTPPLPKPSFSMSAFMASQRAFVLEAINNSLQLELSSLKIYVECLEEDNDELAEELKRTTGDQR